jgi:hypothetical protein
MENEMEPSEAAAKTFYEEVNYDRVWDDLEPESKIHWERAWARAHQAYYDQYEARQQTTRKHRYV